MLKKTGILGAKVDARSVTPTKHYRKIVRDFQTVLAGNQRAVKLDRHFLDIAKRDGKTVKNGRVLIDNVPGMRVIKNKKYPYGYAISQPSNGFMMIPHRAPEPQKSIPTLKEYAEYAKSQLPKGGKIGFSLFGWHSGILYNSVDSAIEDLQLYRKVYHWTPEEEAEAIKSFTIYKVPTRLARKWKPAKQHGKTSKKK